MYCKNIGSVHFRLLIVLQLIVEVKTLDFILLFKLEVRLLEFGRIDFGYKNVVIK